MHGQSKRLSWPVAGRGGARLWPGLDLAELGSGGGHRALTLTRTASDHGEMIRASIGGRPLICGGVGDWASERVRRGAAVVQWEIAISGRYFPLQTWL